MYDFSLVNVPEDTELSVFGTDGRLEGQIREFHGKSRLPVLLDREKAAEGLYFRLKVGSRAELRRSSGREREVFRENAGEEIEKMPKLAVRQFIWRMLGEFETGRPLSGFAALGDRLYVASTDRVWGVDIRNPYSPVLRSQFFTEGIKGIAGHRDNLYLFSPENVQVFRLKENWNPEPVARWDYPDVRRLAFRGDRAYVLQANALSSLDTHEIHCPPLLSRIEVPISSDLLLFGRRLAVASEEGVLLFETEDPYNPVELGVIRERGVSSLEKVGGALALYGVRETVTLYGVGEREEIKSLGTYRVRHRLTGLHFGRDLAFALSPEGTGVQIYVVTENLEKGTVEVSEG